MKILKHIILLGWLMIFAFCAVGANAQKQTNPRTVFDYYMLLPADALGIFQTSKNRKSLVKIQDAKNGYLNLSSSDWEGNAEIALFRKTTGEAVIAVAESDCAPACSGSIKLLQYKNGKWSDATAALMPKISDAQVLAAYNRIKTADDDAHTLADMPYILYELPRKGTTVKLKLGDASDSGDETLLNLKWSGERFLLENAK